jgi:hopanoid biosynthesis associated RND transporter like protein HpnN
VRRAARAFSINIAVRLVDASTRVAVWLLIGVALLTAGLLYYTVTHLSLNTDTEDMLDPNLPFRRLEREFDRAFPQFSDLIVVVVEATNPAKAQDVADTLADRIREKHALIRSVYRPGGGAFFARNGLLYLDLADLWTLDERFAEAEPFLGTMAHDPSLRGLFTLLGRALDEKLSAENEKLLKKIFDRIARAVEAQLAGRAYQVSWRDAWLEDPKMPGGTNKSFILVQPRLDYTSIEPAREALEFTRQLTRQPELLNDGVRARITGSVAIENDELANVSQDGKIVTTLAFALVCLVLLLGLNSPRLVAAMLTTLFIGLIWTGAFATFAIGPLNLISISFAVLFIGMGVDFSIQFAMRFKEEFDTGNKDHIQALSDAAAGVGGALALAAVAAAISFFSFVPTSYKGLAELGIISGASMVVALLASLTVLPALLRIMSIHAPLKRREPSFFRRLGFPLAHYRRAILGVAVLVTLGASALVPQVRFDFNPLNLRDPTTESVATFRDLLRDPDTTPYTIDVLANNLDTAQALAARLEKLDVVDKAVTLASYVPSNQDQKLDIIADMNVVLQPLMVSSDIIEKSTRDETIATLDRFQEKLAKVRDSAADDAFAASLARLAEVLDDLKASPNFREQMLQELEPRVVGDFPKVLQRLRELLEAERVTLASLPQDLKDRYIAPDGSTRIEVFPKQDLNDNRALRRFVEAVRTVTPHAIGSPVALLEGSEAVITACMQATVLALAAIAVLTVLVLHTVFAALLVLAPLLLAIDLTVASSVFFELPFNLANIIALPLLIGLNNAFGIYLVMRKHTGVTLIDLFRSNTPAAVLFSGLTTMASFGTLAIARHPGMSQMGMLISLALAYALLFTLVVLPAIMAEIDYWGTRKAKAVPVRSVSNLTSQAQEDSKE